VFAHSGMRDRNGQNEFNYPESMRRWLSRMSSKAILDAELDMFAKSYPEAVIAKE